MFSDFLNRLERILAFAFCCFFFFCRVFQKFQIYDFGSVAKSTFAPKAKLRCCLVCIWHVRVHCGVCAHAFRAYVCCPRFKMLEAWKSQTRRSSQVKLYIFDFTWRLGAQTCHAQRVTVRHTNFFVSPNLGLKVMRLWYLELLEYIPNSEKWRKARPLTESHYESHKKSSRVEGKSKPKIRARLDFKTRLNFLKKKDKNFAQRIFIDGRTPGVSHVGTPGVSTCWE